MTKTTKKPAKRTATKAGVHKPAPNVLGTLPAQALAILKHLIAGRRLPTVEEAKLIAQAQLEAGQVVQPVQTADGLYVHPT